jgi:hypothetical protein
MYFVSFLGKLRDTSLELRHVLQNQLYESSLTLSSIGPQHNFRNPLTRISWLRHCATSRKFAASIPDSIIGIFY